MTRNRSAHVFKPNPRPASPSDIVTTLKGMKLSRTVGLRRLHLRMRDELNVISSEQGVTELFVEAEKAKLGKVVRNKTGGPSFRFKEPFAPERAVATLAKLAGEPTHTAVPHHTPSNGESVVRFKWGQGLGSLAISSEVTKSDVEALSAILRELSKDLA